MPMDNRKRAPAVLLMDGTCLLCHGITRFVAARDKRGVFRFATLQSRTGTRLLAQGGMPPGDPDTFVMVKNGRYYTKSAAALRVCLRLGGLWPLLFAGIVIPAALRDRGYDYIARRRYRWFGRSEACLMPAEDVRSRFLYDGEGDNG